MALKGIRKIEADVIRLKANQVMEAGIVVRYSDTVDADTNLPKVIPAESGNAKVVGILGDKVIARPAEAEDGDTQQLQGIKSDWIFTEAQPLFQEEGLRFVDEEVFIIRKGLVTTDRIAADTTPSGGLLAYPSTSGLLTSVASGQPVGVWQSASTSDGFAELYVDIKIAA
jgi:hypothetical protein